MLLISPLSAYNVMADGCRLALVILDITNTTVNFASGTWVTVATENEKHILIKSDLKIPVRFYTTYKQNIQYFH